MVVNSPITQEQFVVLNPMTTEKDVSPRKIMLNSYIETCSNDTDVPLHTLETAHTCKAVCHLYM